MASTVPMPSEVTSEKVRLHNIHERIKDEHRVKLCNHLLMVALSSILVGLVTGWETRDLLIQGSISLPTLIMEFFDYLAKL